MNSVDTAAETQLCNIETKTGQDRLRLFAAIFGTGIAKHGEMVTFVKQEFGLGHGDANALVHAARRSAEQPKDQNEADPLDGIYIGPKAHLKPIHQAVQAAIDGFGPHEIAPKKGYVSLRRKKQFAMLGPKTNSTIELGLNLKDTVEHPLLKAQPPGGMCQYTARLASTGEIDQPLLGILRRAYELAG